jgi:hypothetical protein
MINSTFHRVLLGVALLAAVLLADAWQSARHDSSQLAVTLASQKAALQQAADREKQRDVQLAAALAAIASQKRAVQTPHQAATALSAVLPPLPLPISIKFSALSSATDADDLPATISIPQPDLKPLYDDLQDCRASTIELEAIKKDLADEKSKAEALFHERNAALAVAHGGTIWLRLRREAKWFAIGIAAGAAVAMATHHSP